MPKLKSKTKSQRLAKDALRKRKTRQSTTPKIPCDLGEASTNIDISQNNTTKQKKRKLSELYVNEVSKDTAVMKRNVPTDQKRRKSMGTGISSKNTQSGSTAVCLPSTSKQSLCTTETQMYAQLQKEFNFQGMQREKKRTGTINAQINDPETQFESSTPNNQQKGKTVLCSQQLLLRRKKDRERKQQKNKTMSCIKQKQLNKLLQQRHRRKMKDEEKLLQKEKDKIQHRDRRCKMTKEEKYEQKELNKIQHQDRRSKLSSEEKMLEREQDKAQHRNRRSKLTKEQNSEQKELNKIQHRDRRSKLSSEEKMLEREQDNTQHRNRRSKMTKEQNSEQKELNKIQHRDRRSKLSSEEKMLEREQNKVQHRNRRSKLSSEEKMLEREQNKVQHRNRRSKLSSEEKMLEREQNKVQHRNRRSKLSSEEKMLEREQDNTQHRNRRSKMTKEQNSEQKELNKIQHRDRRSKLSSEEKMLEREQNKVQHTNRRSKLSSEEKMLEREQDKTQHRNRRSKLGSEEKMLEREKDKTQHRNRRSKLRSEEKMLEREKDNTQQRNRRQNKKSTQAALNVSYQQNFSPNHDAVSNVVREFLKIIQGGPTYMCCLCYRMLYRHHVKVCTDTHRDKCTFLSLEIATENETKMICKTCSNSLSKDKIPPQALSNNLAIIDSHPTLKKLCNLEKQLISKTIPFMKICSLPKGSQHGLKGQVVLVPSNVQSTADSLPRDTESSQIVALNLKRRLSDKHTFCKEYIRPQLVNEAFHILQESNKHYTDIALNGSWVDESKECDEQLWRKTCMDIDADDNMVDNNVEDDEVFDACVTDSEDEVEKEIPSNIAEDISFKRSLNNITFLYPQSGPLVRSNKVLNLAPAEGQTPTSVFYQDFWETLAFPTLFPDGVNTFHEKRRVSITPKKYVNARLISKDFRFAESAEYTFQCLHWIESVSVNDSVTFALKKARQNDVSVVSLQNPENLLKMFKDDEMFASFKHIRGSPQYWKEMQNDMLAKIRHYGPYTFFISCSAADFHWPELIQIVAEQYGEHYDLHYIETQMDKKTKRNWLARNPVTIARHIDFIFRKLWGNVILSGLHPVGQILNYDIRKEMQSRGTAHFHSAVHVKQAPIIDKNSDEEVVLFIDKYVKCLVPNDDDDEQLRDLVLSRQMHHHTRTCKKKKGLECRFHFPKPPSQKTVLSRMPVDENSKQIIQQAKAVIHDVMNTLQEMGTDHTLQDILIQAGVTAKDYNDSLKISMKKTTVIMERSPSATCINPYNPVILKCIRANMDIQYITDVWACVAYITSYMCKPEKNMSDLMRNACKESTTVKGKLKSIGNVFLKSREVSQHEAIARLIGLPLRESNIPVMFVPTGFTHERTRMVKPRKVLEKMDDEDTDVFLPNIIDKYVARPNKLENMCLAEFASSYSRSGASQANSEHDDLREEEAENVGREKIKLKNNLGTLVRRKIPQVLRDYFVSKDRNSEKYYHRLLLLYFPWRKEEELQIDESHEEKFNFVKTKLIETIQQYEPYLEEVQQATEMLDNLEDVNAEIWDDLAPDVEQNRDDEEQLEINRILDIDNLSDEQRAFDEDDQPEQVRQPVNHSITTNISFESDLTYLAMIRSLNPRQKQIHDHVLLWCRQMNLATSLSQEPPPFHIFLSGGAGVGKSHTVHTIYQTAIRSLKSAGNNTDSPTIILTAPTGKAAVNIGGTTLHNAFRLPVRKRGENYNSGQEHKRLSATTLNSMRSIYCQLKILVIDEISMVGATTLSNLNVTMQDIFENEKPFGNIAVLALGDLMQLNPVGEKPVYKECKSGYAALAPSVWELFKIFELTEIVRQKEDPLFAQLLSRVRVGQHTKQDLHQLKALEENTNIPNNSLSIFLTNRLKDNYNLVQLEQLPTRVYTVPAKDSRRDLNTKRIAVNITSTNLHETAGLASEVKVAEMAKYMQTKNVDIPDGLVNGATGTIMKIDIPEKKPLDGTLYVKFDDPKIGKMAKANSAHKNLVPIKAVTAAFSITEKSTSIQVERTQFPGTLAWGITVHKSQGSTFEQMLGDMTTLDESTNTKPGQIYTMLSRAKSMEGLKLRSFHADKIKVNVSALHEMESLKDNNALQTETLSQCLVTSYPSFCVLYLNIRSLRQHFQDISPDIPNEYSGFLCFSETKVFNYSTYKMSDMECVSNKKNGEKHGNVIYSTFNNINQIYFKTEIVETIALQLNALLLVSVYIPPGTNAMKDIENMLQQIECTVSKNQIKWIVVIGDFNLSFQQLCHVEQMMNRCNLSQVVSEPTHELGAVLDVAFTNIKDVSVKNIPVWFSDHHAIILHLPESR